jgi:mono/diheme cytochrome c family protein
MQMTHHRRWLWALMAMALLVLLIVLIRPAMSSEAPRALADQPAAPAEQAVAMALPAGQASLAADPALQVAADTEAGVDALQVADVPSSDNCITCHTNKDLLQMLAEEPEEVESELASGEG